MVDSPDMQYLQNIDKGAYVQQSEAKSARISVLKEAACSLGARGGLARRAEEIRYRAEQYAADLDATYSFQSVMLEFGVLPPVIVKANNSVSQNNDQRITYAGTVYSMVSGAKFVTVAPTWRSYLFKGLNVGEVELPPPAFLPENENEKKIWKDEVSRCWKMGVSQANDILEYNRNELRRDYIGMIRYKLLALKGDIKAPVVVTESKPVEKNKTEKRLDVRTYSIKEDGGF